MNRELLSKCLLCNNSNCDLECKHFHTSCLQNNKHFITMYKCPVCKPGICLKSKPEDFAKDIIDTWHLNVLNKTIPLASWSKIKEWCELVVDSSCVPEKMFWITGEPTLEKLGTIYGLVQFFNNRGLQTNFLFDDILYCYKYMIDILKTATPRVMLKAKRKMTTDGDAIKPQPEYTDRDPERKDKTIEKVQVIDRESKKRKLSDTDHESKRHYGEFIVNQMKSGKLDPKKAFELLKNIDDE